MKRPTTEERRQMKRETRGGGRGKEKERQEVEKNGFDVRIDAVPEKVERNK